MKRRGCSSPRRTWGDRPTLSQRRRATARRRERELHARSLAVALTREGRRYRRTLRATSKRLGVARSTLSEWCVRAERGRLAACALGRPPHVLTERDREVSLFALEALGRRAEVGLLRLLCPQAPRSALKDLVRRARRVWRRRRRASRGELSWKRVGAVWACDFTEPDQPLVGGYAAVLVVRDLSSGKTLCSEALRLGTASEVVRVMRWLFEVHGAPLILKSDNGSALIAVEVELQLAEYGVLHLRSPVRMPRYNGACEAGIGSLKILVDRCALCAGRVGVWSCDDVEAARRLGNATAHAPCDPRRSPDEVWNVRERIGASERERVLALYRGHFERERELRGLTVEAAREPDEQASIDRKAMRQAAVDAGILEVRWRAISPPI